MKNIRKFKQSVSLLFVHLFLFSFTSNSYSLPHYPSEDELPGSNQIKIALLLDTSGSMEGLLQQAKSQLWKIVNVLSMAKKNDENASLEIALYQYGNDNLTSTEGYIQQVLPLSNDLDKLSEKLFALTTNGGEEYCGHVIKTATNQLDWNPSELGLNLIFIAGNEPFNQGKINYSSSCLQAKEKGITVNTIFCGNQQTGISTFWQAGAISTGGNYMNIDMNQKTVYVATPYDARISALNDSLNTTYLSYGKTGNLKKDNQVIQDNNSESYGLANKVSRAVSKSSHYYYNAHWDLVDASKNKTFKIENVKKETLPKVMQSMSKDQQRAYIKKMADKRISINREIQQLNKRRLAYINSNQAQNSTQSLDFAMINAIKKQAQSKGFIFQKATVKPAFEKAYVNYDYFEKITKEAKQHRNQRLIDFMTFINYSKDKNTIILDTRSKRMYDRLHIKGAIHINFSEFTQEYLKQMIPDTNTRILIYCNNNFKQEPVIDISMASKAYVPPKRLRQIKIPPGVTEGILNFEAKPKAPVNTLALNIPTYINLYGYHYRNVYELSELVSTNNPFLQLEGTDAKLLRRY